MKFWYLIDNFRGQRSYLLMGGKGSNMKIASAIAVQNDILS